jgi:hypothetical protein
VPTDPVPTAFGPQRSLHCPQERHGQVSVSHPAHSNRQYCRLWSYTMVARLTVSGQHHLDLGFAHSLGAGDKSGVVPTGGVPLVGGAGGVVAPCNFRPPRGCGDGAPLTPRAFATSSLRGVPGGRVEPGARRPGLAWPRTASPPGLTHRCSARWGGLRSRRIDHPRPTRCAPTA